jgi:hypothetical protein
MAASWVSRRKPHMGMGCLMGTSPFIKFPPWVVRAPSALLHWFDD